MMESDGAMLCEIREGFQKTPQKWGKSQDRIIVLNMAKFDHHPPPYASHSSRFDQRRRPDTFFTAIATAFFWPTSTTSFLPRVTPV